MRTLLPLLLLAACTQGGVKLSESDTGEATIDDAGDVVDACEDRAAEITTETFRVVFERTRGGCPWGEVDNLQPAQGLLTARVEQTESLDLQDVIICDMVFDFAGEAGLEQDITYDDNFIFTFNDVVLAASYAPWIEALDSDGVFRFYDWSRIAGMENLFEGVPTYCLGEDSDLASCDIPPPEIQGPISLSFDLAITSELSYRAINESRASFGFIATGDNDPDVDCAHQEFFLDVHVPVLPAPGVTH